MSKAAVVSPHYLSAEAGRHVLLTGGNAVDAAIAIVAAQGVVAPETCGVGGDLFALVHSNGEDRPVALNASGRSGSAATAGVLRAAGHDQVPADHPLAVTIPGCVDGLTALSFRLGSLPLAACLEPAITLAGEGFPASDEQSRAFSMTSNVYADNPAVAGLYPGGTPVEAGQTVIRADLARTLRDIADGGRDAFYGGVPGEDIAAVLGPYVTFEDMGRPQHEWVDPLAVAIGEETAWTLPPNSAGYLGPATLAVFLRLDPPSDPTDPLWWHLMIEAHRSLAWERKQLVSDPGTLPVPPEDLVSDERLDNAAAGVSRERAGTWPTPPAVPSGTAYMCATDGDGLSVSIINSNYYGTGSTFGAVRSGFLLQDRGRGFNLEPGHPNELGPGKRPAHTLSPTLWTRNDRTSWLLGTRGGQIQPQLVAQLAARAIVGGDDLTAAQTAPRWSMTEYGPGDRSAVSLEPDSGVEKALKELGHHVVTKDSLQPGWGPMSIVDRRSDEVDAAADPRVDTARALFC
ncbi:MAG: gamma-glutamyltransferase [Acidimicrobiia bacterium]